MVLNTLSSSQSSGTPKKVPWVLWAALQPAQGSVLLLLLEGWEFEEISVKTFLLHLPSFATCYTGLCN